MGELSIEYKGFACTFREDTEQWQVQDIDNTFYKSLSAAKAKIDDLLKADRKVADMPAFLSPEGWASDRSPQPCIIYLLAPPEKGGYGDKDKTERIRSAWVRREGKDREKVRIGRLIPDSALALVKEAERMDEIANAAREAANAAWEAVPRLTAAEIVAFTNAAKEPTNE